MPRPNRILVVDDERQNVELLKSMLEALGLETEEASNGSEALRKLDESIDLVLLDAMMPEMDGFQTAAAIRKHTHFGDVPVIMVTVLDSKQDRLHAVEAGANDFISKPLDLLELRVRVNSLLRVKNAQDRLKASLREKEFLLREIHHRVKNNLAIIISLINLQSKYVKDEVHLAMFQEVQNRIRSMALAHEQLHHNQNIEKLKLNEYIKGLLDHLVNTFRMVGRPVTLETDLKEQVFGLEIIIPVGIILTELVSNCFKHAFPDNRKGVVKVSLQTIGRVAELSVSDNGVGLPDTVDVNNPRSFGLSLVRTFSRQIEASVTATSVNGTEFKLSFSGPRDNA
ncbi:sensor histidine kinase [Desulfomonile tiedjei]|uniref:histidine kinase n=1 Tax=Desulfomonile tiedjei (strain ATCC 49306 / DSM 6799 / DCB-1) TaxID=706587 RepID=I4CEY3_DESTA|nr:response regulator [Desulfomonile tiedjei]AFM28124.1 signal transduction histidine kinase [Desulfomonile tiedjei DSM 6799]